MTIDETTRWRVTLAGAGPARQIVGPIGERIAYVQTHEGHVEHAKLLAAAPILLAAAKKSQRWLELLEASAERGDFGNYQIELTESGAQVNPAADMSICAAFARAAIAEASPVNTITQEGNNQ